MPALRVQIAQVAGDIDAASVSVNVFTNHGSLIPNLLRYPLPFEADWPERKEFWPLIALYLRSVLSAFGLAEEDYKFRWKFASALVNGNCEECLRTGFDYCISANSCVERASKSCKGPEDHITGDESFASGVENGYRLSMTCPGESHRADPREFPRLADANSARESVGSADSDANSIENSSQLQAKMKEYAQRLKDEFFTKLLRVRGSFSAAHHKPSKGSLQALVFDYCDTVIVRMFAQNRILRFVAEEFPYQE